MDRIKKYKIIFFISLVIAAGTIFWVYQASKMLPSVNYDIDDWKSKEHYAIYRDNAFCTDDLIRDKGQSVDFLFGPYGKLQKGSYTAHISYFADQDQIVLATTAGGIKQKQLYESSEGILSKYLQSVSYQFEVLDDVDDFQIVFQYNGIGDFGVRSISITPNNAQIKRTGAIILTLIFVINLMLLISLQNKTRLETVFILTAVSVFVSVPLFINGTFFGDDILQHYNRIEAVLQALRSGQFPARISSSMLYGFGYPFSIYYNDIFLYFPAFLRFIGFSVDSAYKIYVLAINFLSTFLSYYSFKNIFGSKKGGFVLSLFYLTAVYRFQNIFSRAAVGEYTAQAFLPLLALALYNIYFRGSDGFLPALRNSMILALAMSGIIGAHMLTTIMACFMIALFCLCFLKITLQKRTILTMAGSIIITGLLNLYFIVPFIDYHIHVDTIIKKFTNEPQLIQQNGVWLAQFFAAGDACWSDVWRISYTPGLVLMLFFWAGIYVRFVKKFHDKGISYTLFFSFLSLWLSTNLFPWNWMTVHIPGWNYLAQIQYPWRFLVFSILFLTLLAGFLHKYYHSEKFIWVLISAAILTVVLFNGKLLENAMIIKTYDSSGLNFANTGDDYLLIGSSRNKIDTNITAENFESFSVINRNSYKLSLQCLSGNAPGDHTISVPIFNYPNYHIYDESGNEYRIINGPQNRIKFNLPSGYDGQITVEYRDPIYWTAALLVSAVTAIFLSGWWIVSTKKKNDS